MSNEFDILIENATIIDGLGTPSYKGSIAIKKERIIGIEPSDKKLNGDAKKIINAKGLMVTPGFIDVHNHADLSILYYPKCESFVRQGITSFIGGQCGDTPGPYGKYVGEPWFYMDLYQDVKPTMYRSDWIIDRDELNKRHKEVYGWEIDWNTMGDYFKRVEEKGISINYVPLVGHGDIRTLVLGTDYKRRSTKEEITEMEAHVQQAMEDGCRGISVGRTYEPGNWAGYEEILACAKVAAKYGGIYTSHCLRSAPPEEDQKIDPPQNPILGLNEAISIARDANISVQISHLGNQYLVTPQNNDIMTEASIKATLKHIDDALQEGLDINFDIIPHHQTGGIFTSPWLAGLLSPWLKLLGSTDKLAKALRMADLRDEIKNKIIEGKIMMLNPSRFPTWADNIIIAECSKKDYVNKNISAIAEELELNTIDTLMKIIELDPNTKYTRKGWNEEWVKLEYYKHPAMMVGVDTFAVDENDQHNNPPWFLPNENAFGGMVRYLRVSVKDNKIMTWEEAIRKITSLPAKKHKMTNRGSLQIGAFADIVVMNPQEITDKGDQINPRKYPVGIKHVIVNGKIVVKDTNQINKLPGKILYRE
jgi:N-acyl-D-aspartate/D-glutamate deacylase